LGKIVQKRSSGGAGARKLAKKNAWGGPKHAHGEGPIREKKHFKGQPGGGGGGMENCKTSNGPLLIQLPKKRGGERGQEKTPTQTGYVLKRTGNQKSGRKKD